MLLRSVACKRVEDDRVTATPDLDELASFAGFRNDHSVPSVERKGFRIDGNPQVDGIEGADAVNFLVIGILDSGSHKNLHMTRPV